MTLAVRQPESEALEASLFGEGTDTAVPISTQTLVTMMIKSGSGISDLIFSPGRPPQVEQHGELTPVTTPELSVLRAEDTCRVARDVVGRNLQAMRTLHEHGACDVSYSLPDCARFRVNVFRQRGSYAIVMRVIASKIPSVAELNLPPVLSEVASLKNGIVLVTGPTGSGKSSTLAAIIDLINETRAEHVITIEDPIEFLHLHKKATVHQRELHSDTPTFALGASRRSTPGAEGHPRRRDARSRDDRDRARRRPRPVTWFSRRSTRSTRRRRSSASSALSRRAISRRVRRRLAACFRYFISQRLMPKIGGGRVAVLEVLKATLRTREYLEEGEREGKSLRRRHARRRAGRHAALRRRAGKARSKRRRVVRERDAARHQSGQPAGAARRSGPERKKSQAWSLRASTKQCLVRQRSRG